MRTDQVARKGIFWLFLFSFLLAGNPAQGVDVLPLNRQAVFNLYYWMAGEEPTDQDLEDFSRVSGRPTYTDYKPSEMFSRKSLLQIRDRCQQDMTGYTVKSLFKWTIQGDRLVPGKGGHHSVNRFIRQRFPQPTPFIRAEIRRNGIKAVAAALRNASLFKRRKRDQQTSFLVHLYLKPIEVSSRYEKRNIALEDVYLPFRYLVFTPLRLELSPVDNPDTILLSETL
jgi:hypothetical protein